MSSISIMAAVMAVACALVGCHGERSRVKDTLAGMRKHPITLPLERMQCRFGVKDTVVLRMVVYIDSAYCTSCALDRMRQWNGLIADAARYKGDLGYVFIAAPKPEQVEDTYFSIDYSQLDSPVYVDTAYAMRAANPGLPDGSEYHVFLMDENGNVLFVGNPLGGEELKELYMDENGNVLFVGNPLGGEELKELYKKTVRSNIH